MWYIGPVTIVTVCEVRPHSMICMAAHQVVVPCDQRAPFGWPVVPDVYISMAGVSGSGSGTAGSSASPASRSDHGLAHAGEGPPSSHTMFLRWGKDGGRVSVRL